jgi:cysteine desulfurase / selenocysteine lyase
MEKFLQARAQFPIFDRKTNDHPFLYLDTAATAQKPRKVLEVMHRFYSHNYGTVHRAVYTTAQEASQQYEEVRGKISRFIGAENDGEIIFTSGATEGINIVANSFSKTLTQDDEILISAMEHHSNIVPWQQAAKQSGAKLQVVGVLDDGTLDMAALQRLISEKTKIVAITHMSNVLGTINPIEEICRLAHAYGAKVLVDGAQSIPHESIDVQELGVDFFVFSGHKLFGPCGVGALFGKKELLPEMAPLIFGSDMIDQVTFEKTTFAPPPIKFEAGTPKIAEVIGLGAAVDFVQELGIEEIRKFEGQLLATLTSILQEIPGLHILGSPKRRGPLLSFVIDGVHPLDLATLLDLDGVAIRTGHLCAQPLLSRFGCSSCSRASLGLYNTKEDVENFSKILRKVVGNLRRQ